MSIMELDTTNMTTAQHLIQAYLGIQTSKDIIGTQCDQGINSSQDSMLTVGTESILGIPQSSLVEEHVTRVPKERDLGYVYIRVLPNKKI